VDEKKDQERARPNQKGKKKKNLDRERKPSLRVFQIESISTPKGCSEQERKRTRQALIDRRRKSLNDKEEEEDTL